MNMKLYNVINAVPVGDTVTVTDYITGDVLIDCEAVANIISSKTFLQELQDRTVYRLETGKVHGDLIVSIGRS